MIGEHDYAISRLIDSAASKNEYQRKRQDPRPKRTAKASLRITSYNVRSFCNKSTAVMDYMTDNDIDVCCLQETFLSMDDKVKIREVEEYGFKMYSKPRPRHGGGVAIVYKRQSSIKLQINNKVKKFTTFKVMETMLQTKGELLRLVNVYRPPYSILQEEPLHDTVNMFLAEFEEYLDSLDHDKPATSIIVGDINIHIEKDSLEVLRYN